jgi:ribose transport system substrate-binding protein
MLSRRHIWAIVAVLMVVVAVVAPALPAAAQSPTEFKYAVIPPVVHVFYTPFPAALADAEKNLGTGPIEYQLPQNFVQNEQNVIVDGLVAKGYNLMAIQPADPVAGNAEITKLVDKGIKVVTFGGCPEQPSKAPFCLATDVFSSAYQGTKALIQAMGGKGAIVHLTGQVADVNSQKRMAAVQQAITETTGVSLLQTIGDIDTAESAQNAVSSLFAAKRSQINGIICTAYNPSVAVANQMRDMDEKQIKVVAIDTDKIVLQAITDGYLSGTMAQNPYGMAYLSVASLQLLSKGYTWKKDAPFNVDSGTFFVTKEKVPTVDKDLTDLTQTMLKDWATKYFDAATK